MPASLATLPPMFPTLIRHPLLYPAIMSCFRHHSPQIHHIEGVTGQHLPQPDIGGVQLVYLSREVVRVRVVTDFREIL